MNTVSPLAHLIAREYKNGAPVERIIADLSKDGFSESEVRRAYVLVAYPTGPRRWWALFNSLSFPWWSFLLLATIFGLSVVSILATAEEPAKVYSLYLPSSIPAQESNFTYGSNPAFANTEYFASVKKDLITQEADFISANLEAMTVEVYTAGILTVTVPIATKGRPGSWWETPAGIYQIETHEKKHLSGMSRVYQPYSMRFQGNFYIHGWPYYPGGKPVASTFSGGCIRLRDEDAIQVYERARVGMPILVFEKEKPTEKKTFERKAPIIAATAHLAVDIDSGFIFSQGESGSVVPIGSITKLVTALVAAEYISLDARISVPRSAQVATSVPRLIPGKKVRVYDLLFPLLLESSDEAAETLASVLGRERFIGRMNAKALSLGMKNTYFVDPSGASAENIGSAEDLYLLARYLNENRRFILDMSAGRIATSAYGAIAFSNLQNLNDFGLDPQFVGGQGGGTSATLQNGLYVFSIPLGGEVRAALVVVLGTPARAVDAVQLKSATIESYE